MKNKKRLTARFYAEGIRKETIIDWKKLWKNFDRWVSKKIRNYKNPYKWQSKVRDKIAKLVEKQLTGE